MPEDRGVSPIAAVLAVVAVLAVLAVGGFFLWQSMAGGGNEAEKTKAKSALKTVVTAAEAYRKEHDRVYEGMTAGKLKASTHNLKVVDGMPKKGEVGITDYNSDQLVLIYTGDSGTTYKATVKDGVITYDF